MSDKWDDLMQEALDAGVDPAWVERVKASSAGSPLRKELGETVERAKALEADVTKYRNHSLGAVFGELGIKVRPDALNVPSDLDPLDRDKVQEWAVGMNLIDPPAPSQEDQQRQAELEAHQRVADASGGAGTPDGQDAVRNRILTAPTEEEFWKQARAAGMVADST